MSSISRELQFSEKHIDIKSQGFKNKKVLDKKHDGNFHRQVALPRPTQCMIEYVFKIMVKKKSMHLFHLFETRHIYT